MSFLREPTSWQLGSSRVGSHGFAHHYPIVPSKGQVIYEAVTLVTRGAHDEWPLLVDAGSGHDRQPGNVEPQQVLVKHQPWLVDVSSDNITREYCRINGSYIIDGDLTAMERERS